VRIAVLGWGSLMRDPRGLAIQGDFQPDGPLLPIEFARISQDGRLTLVTMPGVRNIRTLWAMMECVDLDVAIRNLSDREGCAEDKIGVWSLK
jgi:hypothetical protein